jgi:TolA-binding protein
MNRQRTVWVTGIVAAVLMVAVGVAINQILNNGTWSWPWFAGAVLFATGSVIVSRRMAIADKSSPTPRGDLITDDHRPLLVNQVTPRQLGVHASRFGRLGDSLYIQRDIDTILAERIREGSRQLVILHGPQLAGTTRTLVQIALNYFADFYLLSFIPDPEFTVSQLVAETRRWADEGAGAVLWLDDITPLQLLQLEDALLNKAASRLWILATVHDIHLKGFRTPEHVKQFLEERAIQAAIGTISNSERDCIFQQSGYSDLRPALEVDSDLLMGRLMVALDQLQDALILGRTEDSTDQVALVRAVTDWYRVSIPAVLDERTLRTLYVAYRRDIIGRPNPKDATASTGFDRSLAWATDRDSQDRPQLVDIATSGRVIFYVPHSLLPIIADDMGQPGAWPVGDALWQYADRALKKDQRRDIGYAALDRSAYSHAYRLLSHGDSQINPSAMLRIAVWLDRTEDAGNAARWYTSVIAAGQPDSAPQAMLQIGIMEFRRDNLDQARHWLHEAISTTQPNIAVMAKLHMGSLEQHRGNIDDARRWYMEVVEARLPGTAGRAMLNLGVLDASQGKLDSARKWWEQAIATSEAEAAPKAMFNLGEMEESEGNLNNARRWYENVVRTGDTDQAPQAAYKLGSFAAADGNVDDARRWYKAAIASRHRDAAPKAMQNLGMLEHQQGNLMKARYWYGKAITSGHPDAIAKGMLNLGALERQEGNIDEARQWLEKAIATGDPDAASHAMFNLGVIAANLGDLESARRWWQRTVGTGFPRAVVRAEQALRELDLSEQELRRAGHFGRYGSTPRT